ncbi:NAC domain-containing protein 35-like isoform X1 [Musa acuminata AAA Group]|uniref:NAC domain-containing protein 35-like isoform X1 n=1 Tax=Musa acuminata AAA Group TaxID=214697 RepID=UPI0031D8DBBA
MVIVASAMGAGDGHEHDLLMPGFRFHPTEEELIEFYLRRKVEGKRFNVELITFLDLYRYDPWELPAYAAIGEKEWFFYVPRDRKYRNGDRPNRVTASGYWKATGADRVIRNENNRSIGLKKTLVFYSGKAPKGLRTSWIMNEYRLPQSETDQYRKIFLQVEISICRVYKRPGVEDRPRLPGTLGSKPSSSRGTGMNRKHNTSHHQIGGDSQEVRDGSSTSLPSSSLQPKPTVHGSTTASVASLSSTTSTEEDGTSFLQSNNMSGVTPTCSLLPRTSPSMATQMIDELNRLVGFNQNRMNNPSQFLHPPSQTQLQLPFNALPMSLTTASDKLWEWSALQETGREYTDFE